MDEAVADAVAFGLPALADLLKSSASQEIGFKVWRRNWAIFTAFLTVSTQWRAIATATGAVYWIGLDLGAVRDSLTEEGIAITPSLWKGLRVMERAARDALNGIRG